jgi:hypothetical protein
VRVDGTKVTVAGVLEDCPDLYEIFPRDLADLVCQDGYSGHS